MLEEAFGDFVIDDDDVEEKEREQLKFIKADEYKAFIQNEGWFLDSNQVDEDNFKATYFYSQGLFKKAYECFLLDFQTRKHNRIHLIALYDSILRCYANDPTIQCDVQKYLDLYENLIHNYSDQLQFWETSMKVVRNIEEPWATSLYLRHLSMLCSTVDLPEYWLAFAQCPGLDAGPHFKLGYLTKARLLLEDQLQHTHGSTKEKFLQKLEKIKDSISEYDPQEVEEAVRHMDFSMSRRHKDTSDDLSLPVYKCRSEQTALRSKEDVEKLTNQFRQQYEWMFENM
ncbi:unnamed protein product [Auanema sp. JU1783]|nr:unnamed protein product [Auanema sp. JU1783]